MGYKSITLKECFNFIALEHQGKVKYGGDQKWFCEEENKKYGCSAVVAANMLLYNKGVSIEEYKDTMETMARILPIREKVGVLKPKDFENGIKEFGVKKGEKYKLKHCYFHAPYLGFKDFIEKALQEDKPIALLILNNSKLQEFKYHWITITKSFSYGKDDFIGVSTWGERRIINLKDIYGYSSYGAAIYIQ